MKLAVSPALEPSKGVINLMGLQYKSVGDWTHAEDSDINTSATDHRKPFTRI